jgi:hypothetical protein
MTRTTKAQAAEATFEAIVQSQATETAKRTRKTRQPIKALNKSAETIAVQAKAEKQRKAESKKALRSRLAYDGDKTPKAPKPEPIAKSADAKKAEHDAYVQALRVDAEALGVDPDTYVAEQLADTPKSGYVGPMLALRTAVKKYVVAANGQPCCGDDLASICGAYPREAVVAGLVAALGLGSNPYLHLNPGQQSMNLRNKARTAIKSGVLTADQIRAALAAA